MEDYERLKLRLACLEMAKQVAIASMDPFGIERRAEEYWAWIIKQDAPPVLMPSSSTDDIPF
jgi:hypothetical protein